VYPAWLTDNIQCPDGGLEEHLSAARALIPAGLLADSGLGEELDQCRELGIRHFWMNYLQDVGWYAQENGRDSELRGEFWIRVAQAAHHMGFPEFVPYCLGKAHGLPRQDVPDLMAAFATLPVALGDSFRSDHRDLARLCNKAAKQLRKADRATGPLTEAGEVRPLSAQLTESKALDRAGDALSRLFSEAFDDLFSLATSEDFPAAHVDHAWAIIATNPFAVRLGGGLASITYADVWWRAN